VPLNDENPNFKMGEYFVIRQLVNYLPRGLKYKTEVTISFIHYMHLYRVSSRGLLRGVPNPSTTK